MSSKPRCRLTESPLTLLKSRTLFGRPGFAQIFSGLATNIENGSYLQGREATLRTRLGVFFCGVSRPEESEIDGSAQPARKSHQARGDEGQVREHRCQVFQGAFLGCMYKLSTDNVFAFKMLVPPFHVVTGGQLILDDEDPHF